MRDLDVPGGSAAPEKPAAVRYGLGSYLAFAFSLLSILVTALLVMAGDRIASEQVRSSIGSNLAELANQTTSRLDRGMFERHREVGLMAQRLARLADPRAVTAELEAMQRTYPNYAWMGLVDPAGRVLVSTGGVLAGDDVSAQPWFRAAREGGTVGDVHVAEPLARQLPNPGGEPMRFLDIAFPVSRPGRAEPDVFGVHLSWRWARDVRRAIFLPVGRDRSVDPLIVASDGTVLLGPPEVEGRKLAVPSLAAASRQAGYATERWPDGKDYLVGYAHDHGYLGYPGLGWRVLVRQNLDEAYAPVRELQWRLASWGLGIALLFSLVGWGAARLVTRPLKTLAAAARDLEKDAAVVQVRAEPYREVAQLGAALDSLVRNLQQKEAALRELNTSLERRVEERSAALRETFAHVRENEQRIQTILESAPDPFIGIDFSGRITDWNSRAEALFGWRRDEIVGRSLVEVLIPSRFRTSALNTLAQFTTSGQFPSAGLAIERTVVDRAGREIPVELRVGVINTGQLQVLCAFMHDISQRKEVERLKSEFVSTVSHELRTPLTSVYGSLRLLTGGLGGALPPQGQQLLEMSIRSCERLIRLINDVLDVERIESGRLELRRTRVNLRPLVERAVRDNEPYARGLGVDLQVDAAGDAWVEADEDRITQVVVNLVSNAAKFSPRGDTVRVVLRQEAGRARVAVLDHGPGIPPEFQPRVFERFAQADSSDRREKGGTGLGLNICRSIVQAHGGSIGFESVPGVRTEFHFELTLVDVGESERTSALRVDQPAS
ncbi:MULTISPECIES: ATP-binding protein [Ramlibacter]|uniref:ATP-binding protein n=1 Tax=Ramlibacter TaxID=174951 RepID=UPI00308412F1